MSSLSNTDKDYNLRLITKLANEAYPNNKVLADLLVVQAIVEGDILMRDKKPGVSTLAFKYNNLFGITSKGTKGYVSLPTWEHIRGKDVEVTRKFAWNNSLEDSIEQRKKLFENGLSFKKDNYKKVLEAPTFEQAAIALTKAPYPYATDPNYAKTLISIYKQYIVGK